MTRTHRGQHEDCFGCKVASINLAPSAMPSRKNQIAPRAPDPAWERGHVGERRADGGYMPYIDSGSLEPIPIKHFVENRHKLKQSRERSLHHPDPHGGN